MLNCALRTGEDLGTIMATEVWVLVALLNGSIEVERGFPSEVHCEVAGIAIRDLVFDLGEPGDWVRFRCYREALEYKADRTPVE